jgi:tetratricopeptide (TPR) repeat protein
MMDDLVGSTLGRYQVAALVGRGGMAAVYRALDPVLNRAVAIKVMHSHLAADPTFVSRFRHEAQAVAVLRHPNIVKVFDFGDEGDSYFMVMEFVDGPTLASYMAEGATAGGAEGAQSVGEAMGGLSAREILSVFPPLCSAIDYATAHGMVHRDIKPANILITSEGEPILTDYGIAKIMGATSYTASGMVLGSAHYMSPEQVQGFAVDHRSDIYSLGVVLFEALAGRVPYDADTTASILAQHLSAPVPPARSLNPRLPDEIQVVLERALAKDPERRYQRAEDLGTALRAALAVDSATAYEPVSGAGPGPTLAPTLVEAPGWDIVEHPQPAASKVTGAAATRVESAAPIPDRQPLTGAERSGREVRRGKKRWPWLLAAGVLVAVVAAAAGVLLTRADGQTTQSTATTSVAASTSASTDGSGDGSTSTTPLTEGARLVEQGDLLVENGELDEGIAIYEEALVADPGSDVARTRMGIAYYLHGDYSAEDSQQQLESAIENNPANAEAWAFLSLARLSSAFNYKTGDYAPAEEAARQALELDPESGRSHAFLGRVLVVSGREEEALAEMQSALDLSPEDPWVVESAGWIHAVMGDWEAAVPQYELAHTYRPNWASFISLLGEALRETGRYDEALEHYQAELQMGQGFEASAYQDIGVTLWDKGDAPGAIENLKQSLTLDDNDDYTHWALGAVWDEQEDYEAALPHLQRAVDLVPNNAGYQEWLGDCLYYLGRYEEARAAIDRALELDPGREGAQRLSGYLEEAGY